MRNHGLSIGSLFAGIGGLELGLEWAGVGHVVWQVELAEYPRNVLAKHWPDADRSVTDVHLAGAATLAPVDLICGGFPCQDLSYAGKGEGLDGARSGLWFEFARVIRELRPRFVCAENVAALFTRGIERVLWDLSELGYDAEWTTLRASDVGAPHRRERVFIVAHRARERWDERQDASPSRDLKPLAPRGSAIVADAVLERREGRVHEPQAGRTGSLERDREVADADRVRCERSARGGWQAIGWAQYTCARMADAHGDGPRGKHRSRRKKETCARLDGLAHRGCAVLADSDGGRSEGERIAQSSRKRSTRRRELDGCCHSRGLAHTPCVADAERDAVRSSEDGHGRRRGAAEPRDASAQEGHAAQSRLGRSLDGLSDRVDRWPSGPGEAQEAWEPPRAIPSKTDPHRRKRLKALGNAVVPQCAYVVGLHVRDLIERFPTRP